MLSSMLRFFSSVVYSASVPATISASWRMPAMRSSTSPTRLVCTSNMPTTMMMSAAALKKTICQDSVLKRGRRKARVRPNRVMDATRAGWQQMHFLAPPLLLSRCANADRPGEA